KRADRDGTSRPSYMSPKKATAPFSELASDCYCARMAGEVRVERNGNLGWLIFDHQERRNAISAEMWAAIPDAARTLDGDHEVRVILMRGAGEVAFVSGADISEFEQRRSGAAAAEYDRNNVRAFEALINVRKPLIALIHGFCVGGGCA